MEKFIQDRDILPEESGFSIQCMRCSHDTVVFRDTRDWPEGGQLKLFCTICKHEKILVEG